MKNQVSRLTKISGGIFISALVIHFIVYCTSIVVFLIYGRESVNGFENINIYAIGLVAFILLIGILFAVLLAVAAYITLVYLIVHLIYYKKCLKGQIVKPMTFGNIVFAVLVFVQSLPAILILLSIFDIFALLLVISEYLIIVSMIIYLVSASTDYKKSIVEILRLTRE